MKLKKRFWVLLLVTSSVSSFPLLLSVILDFHVREYAVVSLIAFCFSLISNMVDALGDPKETFTINYDSITEDEINERVEKRLKEIAENLKSKS